MTSRLSSYPFRLVALLAILLVPVQAWAQQQPGLHKVDRALRDAVTAESTEPQRVIIRTRPGYRATLRQALEAHGDTVKNDHPSIGALTAEVRTDDIDVLAKASGILSVSCDCIVTADGKVVKRGTANTKGGPVRGRTLLSGGVNAVAAVQMATISASLRQTLGLATKPRQGQMGEGVVVAVIDSGIAPVADLQGKIVAFVDFTRGGIASDPYDDYGHGTHVSGLIAGTSTGVAPGASLVGLKVLDATGQGRTSDVLNALAWVVTNKQRYNIQVVNLSLGHPIFEKAETDPLVQAVEAAVAAGLKVMVSAGNYGMNRETGKVGYAGITSPGNSPSAMTVGAFLSQQTVTRQDDRMAPYSSRGPTWFDAYAKPDVVAPGDALKSDRAPGSTLDREDQCLHGANSGPLSLSGTSMATAVASGVAALTLQANHNLFAGTADRYLTSHTVKMVLEYTAIPLRDDAGKFYDPLTQGTGGLNAAGAGVLARAINPNDPVGQPWLEVGIIPRTVVARQSLAWAQNIVWGDNIVWGEGLVLSHQLAWEDNIVWGNTLGDDDNIVWGDSLPYDDDNIVWGNGIFDSDNIVWGNWLDDNIVWGDSLIDDDNIVWGNSDDDNIVWGNNIVWDDNIVWGNNLIGMMLDDDNIVWGNTSGDDDNIVWGNLLDEDNIVWGNLDDDNIVWGNSDDDNIVWGNLDDDNIVWGNSEDDNIVWGNSDDDNIVWGNGQCSVNGQSVASTNRTSSRTSRRRGR
jgi:serine protease AprX